MENLADARNYWERKYQVTLKVVSTNGIDMYGNGRGWPRAILEIVDADHEAYADYIGMRFRVWDYYGAWRVDSHGFPWSDRYKVPNSNFIVNSRVVRRDREDGTRMFDEQEEEDERTI